VIVVRLSLSIKYLGLERVHAIAYGRPASVPSEVIMRLN
jgi:hypothetical protein